MSAPPAPLPLGLRVYYGLIFAVAAGFVLTAPWHVAGRDVGRLSAILGPTLLLVATALCHAGWRRALLARLRGWEGSFSSRTVAAASMLAALFLARVVVGRYLSLDINAWDTTLAYDRPIAETAHGRLLFCAATGTSYLGTHASTILLAFVPLYALTPSPLWLLAAIAIALGGAVCAAFLLFRRLLADDLAAGFLALGFLLDTDTAKSVQYGFHVEVFYPLALFLLFLGLLKNRPWLLAAGVLMAITIKEDAVLLLLGFAAAAILFWKRYRAALAVAAFGLLAFVACSRVLMPHFSGAAPDRPWYASYWASWGDSMPRIALAMLCHPVRLAGAIVHSGIPRLLEPLLFLPLVGPEGLVAAAPGLVTYGAADFAPLKHFRLYYSMPVLPFLFVGAAFGIARLSRAGPEADRVAVRARRRVAALLVLLACALDGPGYVLTRSNPARREIRPLLGSLDHRIVRIQGSLFPHVGYAQNLQVLDREHPVRPGEAVLLAPATNPYPFRRYEIEALASRLSSASSYRRVETSGGLLLFVPNEPPRP